MKIKNKKKVPKIKGRPRTFDREPVQKALCEMIARSNKSLDTCVNELKQSLKHGLTVSMIFDWLDKDKAFAEQYARAKEEQADFLVEEMLQIADDTSEDDIFIEKDDASGKSAKRVCNNEFVQRSRLRVDTRKWIASKLKPKRYGDRLDLNSTGQEDVKITVVYEEGKK